MTVQNRNHTPPLIGPRWQEFSLAPAPAAREASFHASLRECAADYAKQPEPEPQEPVSIQPRATELKPAPPVARGRSWPWSRTNNTLPPKKQLQVVKPVTLETSAPNLSPAVQPHRPGSRVLAHLWSWLHAKYSLSSTKRLRVMEMVPLGEKRFLAVVSVEGREFLIGGGASGVSVVTQLEGALETAGAPRAEFALQGKSA
jgi:Flagellar biosynthesis protein, FliO